MYVGKVRQFVEIVESKRKSVEITRRIFEDLAANNEKPIEEQRNKRSELDRREEERKMADEKRKEEEKRREEERRGAEQKRREEESKKAEERKKQEYEQMKAEEERRKEEEQKKEAEKCLQATEAEEKKGGGGLWEIGSAWVRSMTQSRPPSTPSPPLAWPRREETSVVFPDVPSSDNGSNGTTFQSHICFLLYLSADCFFCKV